MLQSGVWKRVMESVKELITDVNMDCSSVGIGLQAMDSAHVALVALFLRAEGFDHYRVTKHISLGVNVPAMCKILKVCFAVCFLMKC